MLHAHLEFFRHSSQYSWNVSSLYLPTRARTSVVGVVESGHLFCDVNAPMISGERASGAGVALMSFRPRMHACTIRATHVSMPTSAHLLFLVPLKMDGSSLQGFESKFSPLHMMSRAALSISTSHVLPTRPFCMKMAKRV